MMMISLDSPSGSPAAYRVGTESGFVCSFGFVSCTDTQLEKMRRYTIHMAVGR